MSTELSDIAKASARGGLFLFLGNASSTIIMAFASILIARLLGPENYGLYAVAMIAPTFLIALSDLGISKALIRFSARFCSEGEGRKVVGLIKAGIIFKFIFLLLLSLVMFLLSDSIAIWVLQRPGIGLLIRFASIYLVGEAIFTTLNSVFIGLDETKNTSLLMNIQAVTKAVASPLLIILGMGAIGAILGAGLSFLLAAVIGVGVLFLRIFPNLYGRNHGENVDFFQGMRLMVSYGMPLYLSAIIFSFLGQFQSFVLVLFVSNTEIGNYNVAMHFSVLVTLITFPIVMSLFPAFSKLSIRKDRDMVEKMFKLSVKYISLLVIPASFAVAVLSTEIVGTLYGSQYGLAPGYLALYILGFLCAGLGMFVVGSFFNGQGDTWATFRVNLINLGLSMPLAFIMVFFYGVRGLIVSLLASQFLSTIYGLFLARKKYEVTIDWASSLRTGAASLASTALVYTFITYAPIPIPAFKLAAGGFLYLASFLVFAPLLRVIRKVDIENLDELLQALGPMYPIARRILNVEEKILALHVTI